MQIYSYFAAVFFYQKDLRISEKSSTFAAQNRKCRQTLDVKEDMTGTIQTERFDYLRLLARVKKRVQLAQQRAIYSANDEMLRMYWDVGHILSDAQKQIGWGNGALKRLSADMLNDYPEIKGFSVRNCQCMIQFYEEYNQELTLPKDSNLIAQLPIAQLEKANTQPAVAQLPKYNFSLPIIHLPWTHNIILIQRVKDIQARYWYMVQSITNHWSKDFLIDAIKMDYYKQHGALANNFDVALPQPEAEEVKSMLKDPYLFDMLTFTEKFDERDIELGLVREVEKFLLEMGTGFAFMGRQYHLEVSGDDYYIDLLMYNTFMHRYMVIELKNTEFIPEYIGKLNFYCSAVDNILCREGDNKTIGLLLCRTKDKIKAEYALRDINKPIGVSDYELGNVLPKDMRSSLPSIEDIERDLSDPVEKTE